MKKCIDCDYKFTCGKANPINICDKYKKTAGIVDKIEEVKDEKSDVMNFLLSIEDYEEVAEIYIENGIKRDYIAVRYYDEDRVFKMKDGIYERRKNGD